MKLIDAIRRADDIRPNPFSLETKIQALASLDGKIALEIHLMDISEAQQFNYTEEDADKELLAPFPYDKLYVSFLVAEIGFDTGEYNKYENDRAMFNQEYGEYLRWFARTYKPAQGNNGRRCNCYV